MRAREFTINIPINIKFNDNGDPEVDMSDDSDEEGTVDFVSPLQQKLELLKHAAGKQSPVIAQITSDDNEAE